ncbi:hypothetical protein D3C81_1297060 [compost metagenome]
MTMGAWLQWGRAASADAVSKPFMPGMAKSMMMQSAGKAPRQCASAASPDSQAVTVAPLCSKIRRRMVRLLGLSSTSRMLRAASEAPGGGARGCCSPMGRARSTVKQLPLPSSLVRPMPPSIIVTRRRVIDRPSPVPPKRRVVDPSSCWKASKTASCMSAAMPMPVSRTLRRRLATPSPLARSRALTTTSPCGVNLMALPARLVSTWRSRPGSPSRVCGSAGSTSSTSSRPLACARMACARMVSCSSWRRSKGMLSRVSMPASIFEKSRMSLMMHSRASAEALTISRYLRWWASSSESSTRSVMPRMPFIGVRISWLMLARNSLFERLADSATSLASSSARSAAF